jgi:site-specific DNA-methyltransferase (cytosine-N4-specific)
MKVLLAKGYKPMLRPSGHDISDCFGTDNGAAIPPNLISLAHTESNSAYIRYCRERGIVPHPARFPTEIPEFFIRMLTEAGDLVIDPFSGSCATGEAAERTRREWVCCDLVEEYLKGALGRFQQGKAEKYSVARSEKPNGDDAYRAFKPGLLWNCMDDDEPLAADGGAKRTFSATPQMMEKAVSYQPKRATPQLMLLDKLQPSKRKGWSGKRRS